MSCIHIKAMKKAARVVLEKDCTWLANGFHTNKPMFGEIVSIPSKKLHNRFTGYVTHLLKRSEALGEASPSNCSRRRRCKCVPEVMALNQEIIEVDPDTEEMMNRLDFGSQSNLQGTQLAIRIKLKTHREPFEPSHFAVRFFSKVRTTKINQPADK